MRFQRFHRRDQLAAIMNRIYGDGVMTLPGGNLSNKEENGHIWITPAGIDKGRPAPTEINRVRAGGQVEGARRPSSGGLFAAPNSPGAPILAPWSMPTPLLWSHPTGQTSLRTRAVCARRALPALT